MKILITGVAGFIGSNVAKYFILNGHNVFGIDDLSNGHTKNIPEDVEFIKGDLSNQDIKNKLPLKCDYILHLAGQSSGEISFDDPIYDIRTNAESTLLLLKFALKNDCYRFIYAGTMSVYGIKPDHPVDEKETCMPQSFYGVAKLASEHYMRIYQQYGINSTSLRLFNVYGKNQPSGYFISDMSDKIKNNQTIKIDKSIRDFVNVNTVSRVINFIIMNDILGIINVGSGRGYSLKSIINQIGVKLKMKPLLIVLNKKTKIVADLKLLKEKGFKFKQNEKNLNI